jgi:hypothetical protein
MTHVSNGASLNKPVLGPRTDWSLTSGCRKSRDVWPSTLGHSWLSQDQTSSLRVRLASWFGTDDPVVKDAQVGSGRTIPVVREALRGLTLETARSEYLGVRRRCKGRVHPGAGYPAGLPRDSGRGMPWATIGQDVVSVTEEPTASVSTWSSPTESHRNRRQLCWQCGGICHLRREGLRREQLASDRMRARQTRLIIPTGSSGIV